MSLARPFARRSPGWLPKVSSSPGGRTFRVSPLSRQHVIEYYELREALECASVRLATKRRDPERFELIAQELREAIAHPNSLDAARLSHLSTELDAAIEEAARSLGAPPRVVLRRVTLPLAAPGLGAGAALVMLTAMKELPATLLLRPTGTDTLATRLWSATGVGRYAEAAPYALTLVLLAAIPAWVVVHRTGIVPAEGVRA